MTTKLAARIMILEEPPSIPSIVALPSAVALAVGIAERGPVADRTLLTGWEDYSKDFGGFTATAELAIAAHGFFSMGGNLMWVSRTCHFADVTDPATATAAKGSVTLKNTGAAASPATVGPGTDVAPFNLEPGDHIDIDIGAGPVVATFNATPPSITDTVGYPIAPLAGGETLGITIDKANGGTEQTVTAAGGETTAADIANLFNTQVSGLKAEVTVGGQAQLTADHKGTGEGIQITTPGTLNVILLFPVGKVSGTGNVADIDVVAEGEAEAVIEAALAAAVAVTYNALHKMSIATVATGVGTEIQVEVTSTVNFGLDNIKHTGSDATPQDTLKFDGKTPGAYTDNITILTEAATSGDAEFFDLKILNSGVVKKTFPNVTMDPVNASYVETLVNAANSGSDLVATTDLLLPLTPAQKRPANGTSAAMAGGNDGLAGIADADYTGNVAGPTGLYCFDSVSTGRILLVPGMSTPAVLLAMLVYAETHRKGSMFCVLDCPAAKTAAEIVTFVTANAILEASEFGAIYWPRVKISNPAPSVFGDVDTIEVPYSGIVAGRYARNDQIDGGIYESPAGIGGNFGVLSIVRGVEDDPSGGSIHEVEDEKKRNLVYPVRINPITRIEDSVWHIDGGRTLKSTGSFPNIGERRGVIFIEQTLKGSTLVFKHRFNNRTNRRELKRMFDRFLGGEMWKGAFRSKDPATAFYVDVSDKLNTTADEFAGHMTARIGLATNKPNEFTDIIVTQDCRSLGA